MAYLSRDCPELCSRGVVLGYDGRHNSCRWANLAAGVFLRLAFVGINVLYVVSGQLDQFNVLTSTHKSKYRGGVPVYLFRTTVPTPYVPFTIMERGAAAGVMVTASHNPKWDNGYKVYWGNGAQILSPHDKNIQKAILENLEPHPDAFNVPDTNHPLLKNPMDEIHTSYLSKLPTFNTKSKNNELCHKIVYTAMHGVGHPYVRQSWITAGKR